MPSFSLPGVAPVAAPIVLGAATLGSAIARDDALRLLDRFVALGGTAIDTAHCYADWLPGGSGASERVIGDWLASRGVGGRVAIWTKGGHPPIDDMRRSRLRPDDIARDLAESLERLRLPRVPLYWLHRDDPTIPVGELIDALAPHVRAGRIGAIAASNWSPARLDEAAHWSRAHDAPRLCASQCAWSLARRAADAAAPAGCREIDDDALAWHRRGGFPLAAYTPQATGFFAKHATHDFSATPGDPWRWAANLPRLRRARELAQRYAVPINRVALAYVLAQTFPTAAIVGCRTLAQLEDSWAALDLRLAADEIAWLEGEEA